MTTAGKFYGKKTERKMWPALTLAFLLFFSNSLAVVSGHLELCPQDSGAFEVVLHSEDHNLPAHKHSHKGHNCLDSRPHQKMSHKHKPLCCGNNISHHHLHSFLLKPAFRNTLKILLAPEQAFLCKNTEISPPVFFLTSRTKKEPHSLRLQAIKLIQLLI
jgi:hypothetical protein